MVLSRFARFLLVGGMNTALTYLLYLALLHWQVSYQIAYSISFALGMVIAFVLQTRFVFAAQASVRNALVYPIVYSVQYFFGLLVITTAVRVFAVPKPFALAISIVLSIPVIYLLTQRLLRMDKDRPDA
jgi:putative flippase GtrA